MKVRKLIKRLKKMDPDARVFVRAGDLVTDRIESVNQAEMVRADGGKARKIATIVAPGSCPDPTPGS